MNDKELRKRVIDQLDYEPAIDGTDIGVATEVGVVILTGHVRSFAEKKIVERIVSRIKGVKAIALDLEVRYGPQAKVTDDQIAERALKSLAWNVLVPINRIMVKVERGWVTLSGDVKWSFQREAAESSVRKLAGLVGVINMIGILNEPQPSDVKSRIVEALKRDALLDADRINVSVKDHTVTLEGKVHAWHERTVAENAAWAAPGVTKVDDRLVVAA